jgi:septal ring factor EnvC (AmiA/AmiB activator)
MKKIQAIGAAIFMTILIGICMLAIGVNAALNPNTIPVTDASSVVAPSEIDSVAQTQQGNSLIAQYQDREKQYQAQLNQANAQIQQLNNAVTQYQAREKQYQTQLAQANTTAQQLQSILNELQKRGVIRIMTDGSIQIRRGGD